jgi:hypothetical protein
MLAGALKELICKNEKLEIKIQEMEDKIYGVI